MKFPKGKAIRVLQRPLLNILLVIIIINVSAIAVTISKTELSEPSEKNLALPRLKSNISFLDIIDEKTEFYKPVSRLMEPSPSPLLNKDLGVTDVSIEAEDWSVRYTVQAGGGIGTEVLIDSNVYDARDEYNPGPSIVFINDSHGYAFCQKTIGQLSELVYYKTTNGGDSWSTPVPIDSFIDPVFRSFSVWYDQWTPGNNGDLIHIIAGAAGDNMEMYYNYFDTSDDTSGGAWTFLDGPFYHLNAPDGGGTVTISTDGHIFGALWMRQVLTAPFYPIFYKYDSSWRDITPSYPFLIDDDDHGQLLPLSGGDVLCIYEDYTANTLYSFVYDEGTDTWDVSPTALTTIITGGGIGVDDANWGAVLDPDTHNIYLVLNNDVENTLGDIETWVFFDGNRSWSQKTDVVTNSGLSRREVKPVYDSSNDILYAVYIEGNDVFVQNSTDGGISWGSREEVTTASTTWVVIRTNFISTERLYVTYFHEEADVGDLLYGNTIADIDHTPPVIQKFGVDDPGNGFPQFWANVTDDLSTVASVKLDLNDILYDMTLNGTGYWIYQPSSVVYGDVFAYQINNASDAAGNYLTESSKKDSVTFTFDTVFPDVLDWDYYDDIGPLGTFKANVTDSWGEIDTVLVNVTEMDGQPQSDLWAVMQLTVSGYMNDTITMDPGNIKFVITVNDTAGNSFTSSEHPDFVPSPNNPPVASDLTLSRDQNEVLLPIYSSNDLFLNYSFYDEDGNNEEGTEIRWYKNGVLQGSYNDTKQVYDTSLVKGDQWNVTVRPKDDQGDFGALVASNPIIIRNTRPTVSNVAISPGNPVTTSDLNVSDSLVYYDYDGDGEVTGNREILWYNNSIYLPGYDNDVSIPSSATKKADQWYFEVRVFDGTNYSNWVSSSPVNIGNTAPIASNLTITSYPKTGDDLVTDWNYTDANNDPQNNSWIIWWYENNTLKSQLNNQKVIGSGNTSKNQVWYYILQVYDGEDYSGNFTLTPSIQIYNTPPIVTEFNVTSNPTTTDDLIANWTFSDVDGDEEDNSWIIRWYKNNQLQSVYNNNKTIPSGATGKDEIWNYTLKVYDGIDHSIQFNSSTTTIKNTPPTILLLTITSNPKTTDKLVADWTGSDIDGDNLDIYLNDAIICWFNWTGGGWDLILNSSATRLESGNTSKNEVWRYSLRIFDGDNYSILHISDNTTIINSKPYVTNPAFNDTEFSVGETVNITYTYIDADNDNEVESYRIVYWYNRSVYNSSYDNLTKLYFSSDNSSIGDWWQYIVRVYDGYNYSLNFTSSLLVIGSLINNPPQAQNLNLTATLNRTSDNLIADYDYYDSDGHLQVDLEIRWYRNNTLQPDLNDTLLIESGLTAKHDVWNFTIRVYDGLDWSLQYNSSILPILNSPPEASNLIITSNPITTENLTIDWTFNDDDAGDTEISYNVTWYIDGKYNSSYNNNKTIPSNATNKGEIWNFILMVYDGENHSTLYNSSQTTILNTPPTASSLSITNNPKTTDNLTAIWTFNDVDNDSENTNWIIKWYKNGINVPAWDNKINLSSTATSKGDFWYFTVKVNDYEAYSIQYTSSYVQILNTAPTIENNLVSISPSTPRRGDILQVNFTFLDIDGDLESGTEIRWYRYGVLQASYNDLQSVSGSEVIKNDQWNVSVRVSDATDQSAWINSTILTITNTKPVVDVVTFDPTGAVLTSNALFAGFNTSDVDGDTIVDYRITWYNGTIVMEEVNSSKFPYFQALKNLEVPSNYTKKGQTWMFEISVYDGTNWSDIKSPPPLSWIDIENSRPTLKDVAVNGGWTIYDEVNVSYNFIDLDGDSESTLTKITWTIFHLGSPNTVVTETLTSSQIAAGDFIFCTIQPHDGEEFGDVINSLVVEKGYLIVGNTAPEILSGPTILDDNRTTIFSTLTSLHAKYSVIDPDHDESDEIYDIELIDGLIVGAEYRWYRNDELKSMLKSPSVDSSFTYEGDTWMVSVRPRDRYGDFGLWTNSSSIVIGNSAPTILGFSWTTMNPTTIDDLLFSYNYFDHDLDPEWLNMTIIQWFENGTEILPVENQTTLDHVYFKKNAMIHVILQSFDGEEYSLPYRSENITIINARPIASNISINPIISYTTDSLSVNWVYKDFDDDIESNLNRIWWEKNGILESSLNNSKYLSFDNTKKGDIWVVILQVFDGFNYSVLYESEPITILNSPSNITQVVINGNINYTYADTFLKADWNFADPDGDSETDRLIYWFVNNTFRANLTNLTLIPNSELSEGDSWSFIVQISDGEDWSLNQTSQTIFIVDNVISAHGIEVLPDTEGYYREGYYHFWINASDYCVDKGDIYETRYQITINDTLALPERVTLLNNGTDNFWVLNYNLLDDLEEDFISYFDTTAVVTFIALAEIQGSTGNFTVNSTITSNFTIDDQFAPRVKNVFYEWDNDRNPTNLTFYAYIQEFGSIPEDIEVTVFYSFEITNQPVGIGSIVVQNSEALMIYENTTGENLLYLVTVDFSPPSDVEIHFRIQTEDKLGNKNENAFTHDQLQTPRPFKFPGLDLSVLIPLLVIVGVVPAFLIILAVVVRRKQQTRIYRKRREVKSIEEKLADIFSLRAILCRNMFGVPFYTENFVEERRDGELIAGLTSAMTDFVSQVAQRDIASGEFDVLEREGFNILSYHGEYSTTTLIAETKPSSYIKDKLVVITDRIESKFSRNRLQDSEISGTQEPIKEILYETLPLGLFKPLIVDEQRLKKRKKHFSKDEIKWFEYVKEIPSFVDGQQVFYAMTFITSLTLHGIPLAQAFSFLETCYELDVVRNLTEQERSFFEPVVAVERQQF